MHLIEDLDLRINGHTHELVIVRFEIEDGFPGGKREMVITDPLVGDFALTNSCLIEVRSPGQDWKAISLRQLRALVTTGMNKPAILPPSTNS